jgi:hypothetical protein
MDRVIFVLTIVILIGFCSCGRKDSADKRSLTLQFLHDNNMPLKKLKLDGFRLHLNCDSALLLKRTYDDTTKIWTASTLSWYELDELTENIKKEQFGRTQYINSVGDDGRVELVDMHETTFVKRNDSLYQMSRFIRPKLIFHPDMFSNGRQAVKLDEKFNYEGDSIILGRSWIDKDLKHYYITIKNNEDGPTEYSFTFDENLKFIYWEDCDKKTGE